MRAHGSSLPGTRLRSVPGTIRSESKVTFLDGTFTEYEAWHTQQLGDAATGPHRITYRRLTR